MTNSEKKFEGPQFHESAQGNRPGPGLRIRECLRTLELSRLVHVLTVFLLIGLATFFALAVLYSSFCAFTNWKFGTSGDYIRYTNMIWNTGRGEWFRYAVGTQSYLRVHLSFTLGLLGPLFYIWDHPFLLSLVQWLMIGAGGILLVLAGRRQAIPSPLLGAVAVFWFGYHFMQAVQLCEFHSTAGYLLFLPWIYYTLVHSRRYVWIPLLLLCGLREEAGLYALPILLLFAVRDRWRAGYVYAAACLAYVAFATLWLYPSLHPHGEGVFEARREIFGGQWHDYIKNWQPRAVAGLWVLVPCLSALGRPLLPFLALIPLPLFANLASHWPWQYKLNIHYSANVMASLGIALVEAFARGNPHVREGTIWIRTLALVVATLISHYLRGFTIGSKYDPRSPYRKINENGVLAMNVAQRFIPKEGVLTAHRELLSMAANRRDAVYFNLVTPSDTPFDVSLAFARTRYLPEEYRELLRSGKWGVRYADGLYCVLERGADTQLTARFLERYERPTLFLGVSRKQFGHTIIEDERGAVRYWRGRRGARRKPVVLGAERDVEAGLYRFTIECRTGPLPHASAHTGEIILNDTKADRHVFRIPIDGNSPREWKLQSFEYRVEKPTRLEIQVMGGEVDLWLDRAFVERVEGPNGAPDQERHELTTDG